MASEDTQWRTTVTGPELTCGCGFVARQGSVEANEDAFGAHRCVELPHRWYDAAFSFEGFMIVSVLAIAVVMLVGPS